VSGIPVRMPLWWTIPGFYAGALPVVPVVRGPAVVYDAHWGRIAGTPVPTQENPMPVRLSLTVNGKPVSADIEPRLLLVDFLRDILRLTGTHIGCDTAQCGACTIHLNGNAVKCCNLLALQAQGAQVTTIEGLARPDGTMHPMQAAFRDHHGLQCGYCTPGMVMSALDLVRRHPNPSEEQIRAELDGNLCRCTGYHNIVKAVQAGAAAK
jgi:carbon-monoxide dehydrogenase small subunit